jgi:hypothetical protein
MAYAAAGLATASGGATSAEGAIHYSGLINFKFNSRLAETHSFPLSQGVGLLGFRKEIGFYDHSASFGITGAAVSNELRALYSRSHVPSYPLLAAALPRGLVVSRGYFSRFGSYGRLQYYGCGFPQWQDPGTWAIGFRFNRGAGRQYGWVRIKWLGCSDNQYIVQDYAWGDPGDKVKTGQTQLDEDDPQVEPAKSADAVPVSGSLGLLALGAVGLRAWRRSRPGRVDSAAR